MIANLHTLPFRLGKRRLQRALGIPAGKSSTAGDALLKALRSAILNEHTGDEQDWLGRIEQLRELLTASRQAIQVEDFGAGVSGNSGTSDVDRSLTRTVGEISRTSAISRSWGNLLFQIIRHARPERCLELGTSLGISASYIGAACSLNGCGSLETLEGAPAIAALAKKNLASLGLDMATVVPGRFQDTLDATLAHYRPVDFAFIDGHHDRDATLRYFGQIKPHLSDRAIVVFDDILWSRGMRQAWRKIRTMDGSFATVDLLRMGVLLVKGKG